MKPKPFASLNHFTVPFSTYDLVDASGAAVVPTSGQVAHALEPVKDVSDEGESIPGDRRVKAHAPWRRRAPLANLRARAPTNESFDRRCDAARRSRGRARSDGERRARAGAADDG